MKSIIREMAGRLTPHVSSIIGMSQKEIKKRLSVNLRPTTLSTEFNAESNPKTFSITINEALMLYYHKVIKVFVSTLSVGNNRTGIIQKSTVSPDKITAVCKELMQAYKDNTLLSQKGFLLEELNDGQSTVLSRLVETCEYFAVAHEFGHIIINNPCPSPTFSNTLS